ncbi:hypothetical protein D3C87_1114980 [compost metagenome]
MTSASPVSTASAGVVQALPKTSQSTGSPPSHRTQSTIHDQSTKTSSASTAASVPASSETGRRPSIARQDESPAPLWPLSSRLAP